MEDVGAKISEPNLDTIFVPPPEFQSSPLDLQAEIKTVENGAELFKLNKDLPQALTSNHTEGSFKTSTLAQNGHYHDVTLNSPDLFKAIPAQRQNLSKTLPLKASDLFKDQGADLFQTAKGEDLLHSDRTKEVNLFEKSPSFGEDPFKTHSNKEDDPFWSPQPLAANPFDTAMTKDADLFRGVTSESKDLFHVNNKQDPSAKKDLFATSSKNLDIFSPSSINSVDPFPSPITRDLFQDVSSLDDPFGVTPLKQNDPFQDVLNGTPDVFKPFPSKTTSKDMLEITPGKTVPKATFSTPSLNDPSETKLDMLSSEDLLKSTPPESYPAVRPRSSNVTQDSVSTTPQGTKLGILQPTPFSQAGNLSRSPSQSADDVNHVCNKVHWLFLLMLNAKTLYFQSCIFED